MIDTPAAGGTSRTTRAHRGGRVRDRGAGASLIHGVSGHGAVLEGAWTRNSSGEAVLIQGVDEDHKATDVLAPG